MVTAAVLPATFVSLSASNFQTANANLDKRSVQVQSSRTLEPIVSQSSIASLTTPLSTSSTSTLSSIQVSDSFVDSPPPQPTYVSSLTSSYSEESASYLSQAYDSLLASTSFVDSPPSQPTYTSSHASFPSEESVSFPSQNYTSFPSFSASGLSSASEYSAILMSSLVGLSASSSPSQMISLSSSTAMTPSSIAQTSMSISTSGSNILSSPEGQNSISTSFVAQVVQSPSNLFSTETLRDLPTPSLSSVSQLDEKVSSFMTFPSSSITRISSSIVPVSGSLTQPFRVVSIKSYSRASFTTITETTVISGVTKKIPVTIGPSGTLSPFGPNSSGENFTDRGGLIIGVTIGIIGGFGLIVFCALILYRKRKGRIRATSTESGASGSIRTRNSMSERSGGSLHFRSEVGSEGSLTDQLETSNSVDASHLGSISHTSPFTADDRLGLNGEGFDEEHTVHPSILGDKVSSGNENEDPFADRFAVVQPPRKLSWDIKEFSSRSRNRARSYSSPNCFSRNVMPVQIVNRTATLPSSITMFPTFGPNPEQAKSVVGSSGSSTLAIHNNSRLERGSSLDSDHIFVVGAGRSAWRWSSSTQLSHKATNGSGSSEDSSPSSPVKFSGRNNSVSLLREEATISGPIFITRTPSTLLKPPSLHVAPATYHHGSDLSGLTPVLPSVSPARSNYSTEDLRKDLLDPCLLSRLRDVSVASTGSIGLRDHEDYSRPILGVREGYGMD